MADLGLGWLKLVAMLCSLVKPFTSKNTAGRGVDGACHTLLKESGLNVKY